MKEQKRKTLLITRRDIEKVFTMVTAMEAVEEAFEAYAQHKVQMPPKVYLNFEKGDLRTMPACMLDSKLAGVKNVNVHPENKSLPTVMATLTLFDTDDGFPLAVMDATHITKMRTGAAGGIAARYLARGDSRVAGFIGAGVQAESQLEALLLSLPNISEVNVYDINAQKSRLFAQGCVKRYRIKALPLNSIEDLVGNSDVLVTNTPVRRPVVKNRYVPAGIHINAIGADATGKEELDPSLLRRAKIVVDNWEQASHSGEINVPLARGIIKRRNIYADIGEIVSGKKPGRENSEEITIFDSTGLAIQDLACAASIYKTFRDDRRLLRKLTAISLV